MVCLCYGELRSLQGTHVTAVTYQQFKFYQLLVSSVKIMQTMLQTKFWSDRCTFNRKATIIKTSALKWSKQVPEDLPAEKEKLIWGSCQHANCCFRKE